MSAGPGAAGGGGAEGSGAGPGELAAGPTLSSRALPAASPVTATQCWRVEDYVVVQECARCSSFQAVSPGPAGQAGPGPARGWRGPGLGGS